MDKATFEKLSIVWSGGTFLKDFACLLGNFSECSQLNTLRYTLDDKDLEVRKSAVKQVYELKATNKTLETCWEELTKNANIENLHEMPENMEKIKESLKKAQVEKVDKLYSMQTVLSVSIIAHQFKVLYDFYQELKSCDNVVKNKDLFDLIDKTASEIKEDFVDIDEDIKNSEFSVVNSKLDLLGIKFDYLTTDLGKIEMTLNNQKSILQNIFKSSKNSYINSGLQATSSWFKFFQYFKYSGDSKTYLILGSLEAIGYSALALIGYKINQMTNDRINEVDLKIQEANVRKQNLKEIRRKIAEFRIELNRKK